MRNTSQRWERSARDRRLRARPRAALRARFESHGTAPGRFLSTQRCSGVVALRIIYDGNLSTRFKLTDTARPRIRDKSRKCLRKDKLDRSYATERDIFDLVEKESKFVCGTSAALALELSWSNSASPELGSLQAKGHQREQPIPKAARPEGSGVVVDVVAPTAGLNSILRDHRCGLAIQNRRRLRRPAQRTGCRARMEHHQCWRRGGRSGGARCLHRKCGHSATGPQPDVHR